MTQAKTSCFDRIATHIVNAGIKLEQARRKSCSQVANITASLDDLELAYNETMTAPPFRERVDEGVAIAEAPTLTEEVPIMGEGPITGEGGCHHKKDDT